MRHMLNQDEHQEREFLLQDFKTAMNKALRIVSLYGSHWEECAIRKAKPCSCRFTQERRELAGLVPQ